MNRLHLVLLALLAVADRAAAAPDGPVPWTQDRIDAVVRVQISYEGYEKPSVSTGFILASPDNYYVVIATHALVNVHPPSADYVAPGSSGASEDCQAIDGATIVLTRGEGTVETLAHSNCVIHRGRDVSLIPLAPKAGGYPHLHLVARKLRKYDHVYVAGYANGYASLDTVGNGLVSQFTDPPDELAVAHLATTGGMSGGPYLAEDGAVVGFHRGGLPYNQDFAHFTRVEKAKTDLEPIVGPIEVDAPQANTGATTLTEFAVEQARVGSLVALAPMRDTGERIDAWETFQARKITRDERQVLTRLPVEASTNMLNPASALVQAASTGDRTSLARLILEGSSEKRSSCWSGAAKLQDGLLTCDGRPVFLEGARQGSPIEPSLVVLHFTASYGLSAALGILANPNGARNASVHFIIDRDGAIVQLVRTTNSAAHVGPGIWNGVENLNRRSIGVDFVNAGQLTRREDGQFVWGKQIVPENQVISVGEGDAVTYWHRYTAAQLQSAEALTKALIAAYPIQDIVGHCTVTPGRIDPGPAFPLQGFVETVLGRSVPSCHSH